MNMRQVLPHPPLSLNIDGQFSSADDRKCEPVFNPAKGQVIGQIPHATLDDLDVALVSVRESGVRSKRINETFDAYVTTKIISEATA